MSKKDVDNYFNSVVNTYKEMLDALHDLEDECSKGIVDPDKIDQMKLLIEPIKQNYLTWSWMMFLLNKPVRKRKHKKYEEINLNRLLELDNSKDFHPDTINKNNKSILNDLKNVLN